jgi:hypothetical protein
MVWSTEQDNKRKEEARINAYNEGIDAGELNINAAVNPYTGSPDHRPRFWFLGYLKGSRNRVEHSNNR